MDYKNVTIHPSSGKKPSVEKSAGTASVPESSVDAEKKESIPNQTLRIIPQDSEDSNSESAVMRPRKGDKYRYSKMIGRGGMKVVLQVFDNDTMRDVAMALLPDISTRSKLELGRFLREARITASLEHPNIVPVHDIGLDSAGSPYFTMKLLKGETLATVLKKLDENDEVYLKRYPFKTLMLIYIKICNAMAFAHSKGIVHLDLKPENVQLGDYGEVLVLDWGLARKIDTVGTNSFSGKIPPKTRRMQKFSKEQGKEDPPQADGTPGYMAPEQISTARYTYSCQTDIYALGALLYAMITYKNPLQSTEVDEMLRDTLRGNIIRPSLRTENREIPFGIEAVVMKAMSLDPEDRYRSVGELRNEVTSFISGFDTKAEKASVWKKGLLFVKRHKRAFITGGLILLLASQLLLFYMREAKRSVSVWIPAFITDFQKVGYPADLIHFKDRLFKDDPGGWQNVRVDNGLIMQKDKWLYLKESFPGNVKITCTMLIPRQQNAEEEIELVLQDPDTGNALYTWHMDTVNGTVYEEILCAENFYAPRILTGHHHFNRPEGKLTMSAELSEGELALQFNHRKRLSALTLEQKKSNLVTMALRIGISGAKLLKLEVRRLVPPENTLPLYLGEILLQEKLYDKAIQSFLRIEENRRGTLVAREALVKAYQAAALYLEGEDRSGITLDIKKRFASFYPKFNLDHLLEDDVCIAWKNRDFALAAVLLERVFEHDPATRVMEKILALPHFPMSPDVGNLLLRMIRRSRNIKTLDLSNYGLTSLRELSGMKLISLDCSGNKLLDLSGINSAELQSLNCSGNRLRTLSGLKTKSLRYLDCSNNRIRNFKVLEKSQLLRLNIKGNPGRLHPVTRKKLSRLRYIKK